MDLLTGMRAVILLDVHFKPRLEEGFVHDLGWRIMAGI